MFERIQSFRDSFPNVQSVIRTGDSSFTVVWHEVKVSFFFGNTLVLHARSFDLDGNPLSPVLELETNIPSFRFSVVSPTDDGFSLNQVTFAGSSQKVARFSESGALLGVDTLPPVDVGDGDDAPVAPAGYTDADGTDRRFVERDDGTFLWIWSEDTAEGARFRAVVSSRSGEVFSSRTETSDEYLVAGNNLIALAGGGFAAVLDPNRGHDVETLSVQLFNDAGERLRDPIDLGAFFDVEDIRRTSFLREADGDLLVLVDVSESRNPATFSKFALKIDPDGFALSEPKLVYDLTTFNLSEPPSVMVDVSAGRVLIVAEDSRGFSLLRLDSVLDDPLRPIFGNDGAERLIGTSRDDLIRGFGGNDSLFGGRGDDAMSGEGANDRVFGLEGDDSLYGGAGVDFLNGGDGADLLDGGGAADTLVGGGGGDRLMGASGADRLIGNAGADRLFGGGGDDVANGGAGADQVLGGFGADRLFGLGGDDTLNGMAQNDRLLGGAGADALIGGAGNDFLDGETDNDRLLGGGGNDTLIGRSGNDLLNGGGLNDRLIGNSGSDTLIGGGGSDILAAGAGGDRLTGGAGADRFVFSANHGFNFITDFQNGVDRIGAFGGGGFERLSITEAQGDAVIRFGNTAIRLDGVDSDALDRSDFIF